MQEAPVVVLPQVLAGFPVQVVQAPELVDHGHVALVVVVKLPQAVLEPPDHGLGPVHLECRKAVPHAREGHLHRAHHGVVGKAEEVVHGLFHVHVGTGPAFVRKRGLAALAGTHVAGVVVGEGNAKVQGRGPEAVVVGRGVAAAARELVELDSLEAQLGAVLQFPHRVVDAAGGNDAHGNDPVGRRRHVFLAQELVVGAHQLAVKFAVPGLLQHEGDLREHDLRVDAVPVLFLEPLRGRSGAGAGFESGHLRGHVLLVDAHASGDADGVGLAAVHHHRIRAVGHLHAPGRAFAHGGSHPVAPDVRVEVDVAVGRNDVVLACHDGLLSRAAPPVSDSRQAPVVRAGVSAACTIGTLSKGPWPVNPPEAGVPVLEGFPIDRYGSFDCAPPRPS